MRNFITFSILLFSIVIHGQQMSTVDSLKFYADVIANAGTPAHRSIAQNHFQTSLEKWLASSDFNEDDLQNINWLSVKSPEDNSFHIITWQLKLSENDHQYFGYIRRNGKVIKLTEGDSDDLEYDYLSPNDWAGVLYYNLLTVKKNKKKYYILFGFDGYKNYTHRKIADVLTFEGDEPVFGAELFQRKEKGERGVIKNRLVLDYSSDANVSLNFNPNLDMIVMDHLIPRIGRIPGQGETYLPDGSYVGYKWDGKYFNYIDKLYHQISEEPPMPAPVIEKGKTITGKPEKK